MANAHTHSQREFIVRRLAAFEPPRAIVAQFRAIYRDTACDENDVLATDPETAVVSPELFVLFRTERERVLLDPKSAPYAAQQARLIALSNQARFYASNNQLGEQRVVLRQIAEEMGVLGSKGGKDAKGGGKSEGGEPVVEIVRRIVDPQAPEPAAESA